MSGWQQPDPGRDSDFSHTWGAGRRVWEHAEAEIWWLVDATSVVSGKESCGGLSEAPGVPKRQTERTRSAVATCNPRSNGKEGRQEAQGSGLLPQPCCGLVPRKPRLPGLGKGAP